MERKFFGIRNKETHTPIGIIVNGNVIKFDEIFRDNLYTTSSRNYAETALTSNACKKFSSLDLPAHPEGFNPKNWEVFEFSV